MTKPAETPAPAFEATFGLVEMRLAAARQDKTFRFNSPIWVLFSAAELAALKGQLTETL